MGPKREDASKQTDKPACLAGKQASTLASKVTNKTRTTATCVVLSYHAADHDKELLSSVSMGSHDQQTDTDAERQSGTRTDRQKTKTCFSFAFLCALCDRCRPCGRKNKQTNKQTKETDKKQTNKQRNKKTTTNKQNQVQQQKQKQTKTKQTNKIML